MDKSQYKFSMVVGASLVVLGAFVATVDVIGFSLLTLGVALLAITLYSNRRAENAQRTPTLIPVASRDLETPEKHTK